MYHPNIYKTQWCNQKNCSRQAFCAFAHNDEEKRETKLDTCNYSQLLNLGSKGDGFADLNPHFTASDFPVLPSVILVCFFFFFVFFCVCMCVCLLI